MSYLCITLVVVKEILGKVKLRKASSMVRQLPDSVAVDNHSLVEYIQEGTSTSARNENKKIYSETFSRYESDSGMQNKWAISYILRRMVRLNEVVRRYIR